MAALPGESIRGRQGVHREWGTYIDGAAPRASLRNPQRTSTAQATMAIPIVMKPAVTTFSCHGWPPCGVPVMGERADVPKTAAVVVINQLP